MLSSDRWYIAPVWIIWKFPFDFLMVADPFFMFFMKSGRRLSEILSKTNVVETYSLQ